MFLDSLYYYFLLYYRSVKERKISSWFDMFDQFIYCARSITIFFFKHGWWNSFLLEEQIFVVGLLTLVIIVFKAPYFYRECLDGLVQPQRNTFIVNVWRFANKYIIRCSIKLAAWEFVIESNVDGRYEFRLLVKMYYTRGHLLLNFFFVLPNIFQIFVLF